MLALAITALFTLTGVLCVLVIADTLLKARVAYVRLMREGEVMRAGFAVQAAAVEMSLRPAGRPVMPRRVSATARPLRACAAA